MVISNSSSNSMTSSTISRESAPISSVKEVERVTCSLFTPRFSQTISITRSSTEGTTNSSLADAVRPAFAGDPHQTDHLALGYVPQPTPTRQDNLAVKQVKREVDLPAREQKGKATPDAKKRKEGTRGSLQD